MSLPRTVVTKGGEQRISKAVIDARAKMEKLLPEALDAYEEILRCNNNTDRRLAAKDVLAACGVVGGEGSTPEGSMASESVIKLVQEIGKAFGIEKRDVIGARVDRAKPVGPAVQAQVKQGAPNSDTGMLSDDLMESMEEGE